VLVIAEPGAEEGGLVDVESPSENLPFWLDLGIYPKKY